MRIAKTSNGYAVINPLFGIQIKFTAKTQRACIAWCKAHGVEYTTGWTY